MLWYNQHAESTYLSKKEKNGFDSNKKNQCILLTMTTKLFSLKTKQFILFIAHAYNHTAL